MEQTIQNNPNLPHNIRQDNDVHIINVFCTIIAFIVDLYLDYYAPFIRLFSFISNNRRRSGKFLVIVNILLSVGSLVYIINNQSGHHFTSPHFQVSNITYYKFDYDSLRLSYNLTILLDISKPDDRKQLYTHNDFIVSFSTFNMSLGSDNNVPIHLNPGESVSVKLSLSEDNKNLGTKCRYFKIKMVIFSNILRIRSRVSSHSVEQP